MTEITVVNAGEGEPVAETAGEIAEAGAEASEAVAEAAVEIAEIEADRDIALAEIHAEAMVAADELHTEARIAEAEAIGERNEGIEECRLSIAALSTTVEALAATVASLIPSPSPPLEQAPLNPPTEAESPEAIAASVEAPEPERPKRRGVRFL